MKMKIITILFLSVVWFSYGAISDAKPTVRAFLQNLQDLAEVEAIAKNLEQILKNGGVGFTANRVVWAMTSDDAGLTNDINNNVPLNSQLRWSHIIFLEKGNKKAGLEHIVLGHAKDFEKKDHVSTPEEISDFMYNVMAQGRFISHTAVPDQGGLKVVYRIQNNKYLHVVISSNGFIVTAFSSRAP